MRTYVYMCVSDERVRMCVLDTCDVKLGVCDEGHVRYRPKSAEIVSIHIYACSGRGTTQGTKVGLRHPTLRWAAMLDRNCAHDPS